MAKQISVGVVGTSWYADLMHLPAVKSHPQAKLVAVCGRNGDRAQEMADKYDIPKVFTDYQEMIDKGGLDALIVAIPDDLHYPVTMAALDAGLHVLCEKSLALTLEHAKEMYAKAEDIGVKHMTYFTWRWVPPFQYLRRLIEEGYLGQHFYTQIQYVGAFGRTPKYQWKWDRSRGLGTLGDQSVHMIDMAHWLVGDIAKVNAHLSTFITRPGIEEQPLDPTNDSALLTLKFKDGSQGVIYAASIAHLGQRGQQFQIILYGAAGTLELDFNFGEGYVVRGAKSDEGQIKPLAIPVDILNGINPNGPFMAQLKQVFTEQNVGTRLFIDAIVNNRAVSPSFYDGLKAQEVIETAIESDQRECWISLQ